VLREVTKGDKTLFAYHSLRKLTMKLMILNLPRSYTENELAKLLKAHGNIKGCDLVMDANTGKSKGFGFVEMALEHEGKAAIAALNGTMVGQRKIRVKVAS
jgi:RNA recognition motif-containing protein